MLKLEVGEDIWDDRGGGVNLVVDGMVEVIKSVVFHLRSG